MHRHQFSRPFRRRGTRIHRRPNGPNLSPHKDCGVAPPNIFLPVSVTCAVFNIASAASIEATTPLVSTIPKAVICRFVVAIFVHAS